MSAQPELVCDICGAATTTKGFPFTVQTLGMHKYHSHRIHSPDPRRHKKKPKAIDPLVADDLIAVVLEQMFPNGLTAEKLVAHMPAIMRWRDATIEFMKEVG